MCVRHFTKDTQLNRYTDTHTHTLTHTKRCSTSLTIMEMSIKAIMIYHYTPIRTTKIKILTTTNAGEDEEKLNLSYIPDCDVRQFSNSGK